jgi:hypothetical protein
MFRHYDRTASRAPGRTAAALPAGAALVLLLAAIPLADDATAQVVTGRVVAAEAGRPVEGAVVRLIDADSQHVAMLLTDRDGRFVLVAPRAGRYILQVDHVAFAPTRTAPFHVPPTGAVNRDVIIAPAPRPGPRPRTR